MKSTLTILIILSLLSCNKRHKLDNTQVLKHLHQENISMCMNAIYWYEDHGQNPLDKKYIDLIKLIRKKRDTIKFKGAPDIVSDKQIKLIQDYSQTLKDIDLQSNLQDTVLSQVLSLEGDHIKNDPIEYMIHLSIVERSIIKNILSRFNSHIGLTLFPNEFQFNKPNYKVEDLIKFVVYPTKTSSNMKLTYDSVEFHLDGQKKKLHYDLEQVVRTAVVEFKPNNPGNYLITVHSTFSNDFVKYSPAEFFGNIEVKR